MDNISPHSIKLIVGLGNPGKKYEKTRHNVGFMLMDTLSKSMNIQFHKDDRWDSWIAISGEISLLKPSTFMNLSGEAVVEYVHYYRLNFSSLLIILDDISLPLGQIRFRTGGSAGGHHGLESVLVHLCTEQVPRLRIGIGQDESSKTTEHVLSEFHKDEEPILNATIQRSVESIHFLLQSGMEKTMNRYNAYPSLS